MPDATASSPVEQIVYLSNRPEILAETLRQVRHFLPWLREAVVLAPAATHTALTTARAGEVDPLPVVAVVEEDLLAEHRVAKPREHAVRNPLLRRLLYTHGPVADVFLQSDDDYRPLRPLDPSAFVDDDGRLVSYACYDLAAWRRAESGFDGLQHAAYLAMLALGGPHLHYASHMPQPLDRADFLAAYAAADRLDPDGSFCEWSLPLNHGRLVRPDRYAPARTFRTMCWPRYPHEWPFWRRPEDIAFENFHPELYVPGGLFAGLPTTLDPDRAEQQMFAKLRRWYAFDLQAGRLQFPADVDDPWRTGGSARDTAARRAFFKAAQRARRLWEYTALEERTRLTELGGEFGLKDR